MDLIEAFEVGDQGVRCLFTCRLIVNTAVGDSVKISFTAEEDDHVVSFYSVASYIRKARPELVACAPCEAHTVGSDVELRLTISQTGQPDTHTALHSGNINRQCVFGALLYVAGSVGVLARRSYCLSHRYRIGRRRVAELG